MARQLDQIIVIDVESTCWDDADGNFNRGDGQQSEIIEIGVAAIDVGTQSIAKSESIIVRPERSKVSKFCTKLTSLTQADVDKGISFERACSKLKREYHIDNRTWASWGDYDRVQFERECKSRRIRPPFGRTHINVKNLFSLYWGIDKEIGMDMALTELNLELEGRHHRGVDDAKNIAKLLLSIVPYKRTGLRE
jgi:inhibitor of KinA sporulation pathway (predicted exonuclease)